MSRKIDDRMPHRVDISFIGNGAAKSAYGGHLHAWSLEDFDGKLWFKNFRKRVLDASGKRYLPVYRMADGEYRFLMGRRINLSRRPLWRELAGVAAERLRIKDPNRWQTSWGETYPANITNHLRSKLVSDISYIATTGNLACYINDNGLNAFIEYNSALLTFMSDQRIAFNCHNYIPFHFVAATLCDEGFEDFYDGRNILLVSGFTPESKMRISENLRNLGVRRLSFLNVSATNAMLDELDLTQLADNFDFCFVAAGIGSANILRQLEPLQTVSLDIGGFMNCLIDKAAVQHGGCFRYPTVPYPFGSGT